MKTAPVSEGRVAARGEDLSGFPHRRNLAKHLPRPPVGTRPNIALRPAGPKLDSVDSLGLPVLDFDKAVEGPTVLRWPLSEHEALDHLENVSNLALVDRLGAHVVVQAIGEIAATPLGKFHLVPPTGGTLTRGAYHA